MCTFKAHLNTKKCTKKKLSPWRTGTLHSPVLVQSSLLELLLTCICCQSIHRVIKIILLFKHNPISVESANLIPCSDPTGSDMHAFHGLILFLLETSLCALRGCINSYNSGEHSYHSGGCTPPPEWIICNIISTARLAVFSKAHIFD